MFEDDPLTEVALAYARIEGRARLRRRLTTPQTIAPGSDSPYDPAHVTDAMLNIAPLPPASISESSPSV